VALRRRGRFIHSAAQGLVAAVDLPPLHFPRVVFHGQSCQWNREPLAESIAATAPSALIPQRDEEIGVSYANPPRRGHRPVEARDLAELVPVAAETEAGTRFQRLLEKAIVRETIAIRDFQRDLRPHGRIDEAILVLLGPPGARIRV